MARYSTSLPSKTITGTTTIVTPDSGSFVQLTGTAPYTVTLPPPAAFPGSNFTFHNTTTGTNTISTPSGAFIGTGGSGTASILLFAGNVASVTSDGANYVVISEDGSALVATTAAFSGDVTINGGSATVAITPSVLTIAPTSSSSINNVVIGNTTRAAGSFTSVAANNQVTVTAGIASSSTSTGSLVVTGGIGASGTVNAATVAATSLAGTLQTAAQPNITSVGTLSNLTVTNTITGSVSGSAATVTNAAQPNITSVGNLSALTVSGILYPESQIRMGVNTFVRQYVSGYSSTHNATAPQEIGRLTFTGNNQNITIVGEIRVATGATVGINRFILNLRSNILPDKSFSFYEETTNLGFLVNARVFQDTASGLVVIGYSCPASIQNMGWSLTIQERGDYNYFQQVNTLTPLNTAGLTEVTVTPSTRTSSGNFVVTNNVGIGQTAPVVSLDIGSKTDAIRLPNGTTAQRLAGTNAGSMRFNTNFQAVEFQTASGNWVGIGVQDGSSFANAAANAASIKELTGTTVDGVYWINLPVLGPTQVYCDMNTDGGGWMMMAYAGSVSGVGNSSHIVFHTIGTIATSRSYGQTSFSRFDIARQMSGASTNSRLMWRRTNDSNVIMINNAGELFNRMPGGPSGSNMDMNGSGSGFPISYMKLSNTGPGGLSTKTNARYESGPSYPGIAWNSSYNDNRDGVGSITTFLNRRSLIYWETNGPQSNGQWFHASPMQMGPSSSPTTGQSRLDIEVYFRP